MIARSLCNAVLACVLVLGGACRQATPTQPNVLVIAASALRADAVGCYGGAARTPALDALARESVRFEAAYASAPWIAPSVASLFTGRTPSQHGFQNTDDELAAATPTLARVLRANGYATHAVVSDFLLGPARGITRDFERVEQVCEPDGSSSDDVAARASAFLAGRRSDDAPFFLFAHFADAAPPFVRHAEDGGKPAAVGELDGGEPLDYLRVSCADMSAAERDFVRELALGEVRAVDRAIGRVLAALRANELDDDTLVMVVGTHGCEWLEHGWFGDGYSLNEELVRVPLLVRERGERHAPRTIAEATSTGALAATVLELAGIPPAELGGAHDSLAPRLRGDARASARPVVLEVDYDPPAGGVRDRSAHARAVVWDGYKLVRDSQSGALRLTDLRADPGELRDLSAALPKHVRTLTPFLEMPRAASLTR